MRQLERSAIVNTLCFVAAAAATVVACSTDDPGTTPDDAGAPVVEAGTTTPPEPVPDAAPLRDSSVTPPKGCATAADCPSGVCNLATKVCAAATCKDGVKNAVETDIDCGGTCTKCDTLKRCSVAADCISGVCVDPDGKGKRCQAPTNTDGVKNGNETGVDCGNTGNPACADGQGCATRDDCTSKYCKALVCTAVTPNDLVQDGDETDVDCGGLAAKPCADGLMCLIDGDCTSLVCANVGAGLRCQPPSYTDGKKNGAETDVDCGGDPAHPCATGKSCKVGGDCTTLGCNYLFKCAAGRSCTNPGGYGADTCGFGGEGRQEIVDAKAWEDCCVKLPVTPASGPTAGQAVLLDKYQVTAGRMRVFLESVGYDVRGFVKQARLAGKIPVIPGNAQGKTLLEEVWDPFLPTSFAGNVNVDEVADCAQGDTTTATGNTCKPGTEQPGIYTSVRNHLGGIIFKGNDQTLTGCFVGHDDGSIGGGTHAFRFPDAMQDGVMPHHDQSVYDTKSMQCIPYLTAQAFCIWDGGRLELGQEWLAAWGPTQAMPWSAEFPAPAVTPLPRAPGSSTYFGCRFPWALDSDQSQCANKWSPPQSIEYADYQYSYEFPKLVGYDFITFITAPGRTRGRGVAGHADVIGGNYSLTSNVGFNLDPFVATHGWNGGGSWEVHGYQKGNNNPACANDPTTCNGLSRTSNLLNKYGKLGLRCAYPM
jgi:hypothetical protein